MSHEGEYVILAKRGMLFGYLYPAGNDDHTWVTDDINKALTYTDIKDAEAKMESIMGEAFEAACEMPPTHRLELRIIKIEKEMRC
jgi:hypothetical protein